MTTRMGIIARAVVLGLGASLLAIVGPSAGPASADIDITVVWPELTELNPKVTDYTVHVEYDGPGTLTAYSNHLDQKSLNPTTGDHVLPLGSEGLYQWRIRACPGTGSCTTVSISPDFMVYTRYSGRLHSTRLGPEGMPDLWVTPHNLPADVTWEIRPELDRSSPPLVTGSAQDVPPSAVPPIGPTDALVDGARYRYTLKLSSDTAEFGHLDGVVDGVFMWDTIAPSGTVIRLLHKVPTSGTGHRWIPTDRIYPAKDGHVDRVGADIRPQGEPIAAASMTITDPYGTAVRDVASTRDDYQDQDLDWFPRWSGRDEEGRMLPEGSYSIEVEAADEAGNVEVVTGEITLSHDRKVWVDWRRTFSPTESALDKSVGNCGRLLRPARATWAGSFGYRSMLPCARRQATVVATTHGVRVPYSRFQRYREMRVTVTGGKAAGERSSYLMLHYLNRARDWVYPTQLGDNLAEHRGELANGTGTILGDWDDHDPYVIWAVGLMDGAKYDVKRFAVELKYMALR